MADGASEEMTTWISLDLDYITGDNRRGDIFCCAWQCIGCGRGHPGRALGKPLSDAPGRFAEMRNWLMELDIIGSVIVRDCHADIAQFVTHGDKVINFDAHFDDERYLVSGDELFGPQHENWKSYGGLDCGNWTSFVRNHGVGVEHWTELEFPKIDGPVGLFVAVSVPYTSTVCDEALLEMLREMRKVDFDLGVRA